MSRRALAASDEYNTSHELTVGACCLKHIRDQSCTDRCSRLVFFVLTGVWEVGTTEVSTASPRPVLSDAERT